MTSSLRKATDICQETREVLDPEEDVEKIEAIKSATTLTFASWEQEHASLQDQIRGKSEQYMYLPNPKLCIFFCMSSLYFRSLIILWSFFIFFIC